MERQRHRRLRWGLLFGIIIAFLAVSAVLLQPWSWDEPSENEYTPPDDSHVQSGIVAPDFSLIDLEGASFQLSDVRGRVVVIDFMATWCGPCRAAMPHYGAIWEQYANAIVMISIDVDPFESEETLRSFANEFPYATWTWAKDTANLGQTYHIIAIPSTVIVDQEGYIRFTHIGVINAATLSEEIEQLLR